MPVSKKQYEDAIWHGMDPFAPLDVDDDVRTAVLRKKGMLGENERFVNGRVVRVVREN